MVEIVMVPTRCGTLIVTSIGVTNVKKNSAENVGANLGAWETVMNAI